MLKNNIFSNTFHSKIFVCCLMKHKIHFTESASSNQLNNFEIFKLCLNSCFVFMIKTQWSSLVASNFFVLLFSFSILGFPFVSFMFMSNLFQNIILIESSFISFLINRKSLHFLLCLSFFNFFFTHEIFIINSSEL